MRNVITLLLISLIAFSSCHTSKKAQRRRAKEKEKTIVYEQKHAPHQLTTAEYIATYQEIAIEHMKKYGIPASIILAQGILESANGNSELARYAHNHFGIKCSNDWKGRNYFKDDDHANECFRSYSDVESSYRDHVNFLKRPRYAALFSLRRSDYKGWARGLKKAGYATNPKYPELLIGIIEKYQLNRFD